MSLPRRTIAPLAVLGAVAVLAAIVALRITDRDRRSGSPSSGPTSLAVAGAGRITIGDDPPWATRAQWPTRGRIESVTITGRLSRLTTQAYVYLPPQYFQPRYAHTRFPGVEILTGYPGRVADLIQGIDTPSALLSLLDAGQAQAMVLVMMRPAVTYPRDTECTDVPSGPQVQTFFASDLPTATVHAYRVRASDWGALGISTGGYCAAKLAMLHPGLFPTAVSISGYPLALRDHTTGDLWGGSTARRDHNNLDWRLQHLPVPRISLLVTMGSRETGFAELPAMRHFLTLVKAPMRVASIIFPTAQHNVASFNHELTPTLTWLSAHLPRAAT